MRKPLILLGKWPKSAKAVLAIGGALMIWISPWLQIPIGAALATYLCSTLTGCPEGLSRVAKLATYATLPLGLAGIVIPLLRWVVPGETFLKGMMLVYRLHTWLDEQVWLEPKVLVPLFLFTGTLSIALAYPTLVSRLGQLVGYAHRVALGAYVLSLFSFVAPGPFLYQLGNVTQEQRTELKASLSLNVKGEETFLAEKAVAVALTGGNPEMRTALQKTLIDEARLIRRIGCSRDEFSMHCELTPDFADTEFAHEIKDAFVSTIKDVLVSPGNRPSIPDRIPTKRNSNDPPSENPEMAKDLPEILHQNTEANNVHSVLEKKREEALDETVDNVVGSLSDLLLFRELVKAAISEVGGAVVKVYGSQLFTKAINVVSGGLSLPDDKPETEAISGIPEALRSAATRLNAAVKERGPLVLLVGMQTPDELQRVEKRLERLERSTPPDRSIIQTMQNHSRVQSDFENTQRKRPIELKLGVI